MLKTNRGSYSRNNNGSNNNKYRNNNNNNGKRGSARPSNPQQSYQKSKQARDKYLTLAREALATGDRIEAENYFQHADHYTRIMNTYDREDRHQQGTQGETLAVAPSVTQEEVPVYAAEPSYAAPGEEAINTRHPIPKPLYVDPTPTPEEVVY